ncbi:MAG TPA: imelysin family protein [Puia sp.]|nr:imelysin family protein [Puia sp.]
MQRKIVLPVIIAATFVAAIAFSCSKSGANNGGNGGSGGGGNSSGQDSILLNLGNNVILPGYQSLNKAVSSLDSAITDFNSQPGASRLSNVQTLFKNAYLAWVSVSAFNYFGPAYSAQPVLTTLNVFPTSTTRIESNVSAGSTDINTFVNTAAKGFPALDYLLFGGGGATINGYTTDGLAANRKKYLAAVSADIKTEIGAVATSWNTYVTTFISGKGNSVSSSLGLLINSMDQDFEITKNDRLGIPLGLIPVGTTAPVQPKEVEAYYSGISVQLALAQVRSVQGIVLGTGGNGNGLGLIDYVVAAKAKYGTGLLSDTIRTVLAVDVQDFQAIPDPLSQSIQTNASPAQAAFTQSQKLVALLKADMPSALGVLITYGDNDGD